ncbi:MAG: hypothetical protein M1831_005403 [Alyxoria varia]|nr:MAG: hypothetical protein M1831_005403 [Alyxoria varia]
MTRLNYVNRKSEGPKLGAIVAKDLRKKVKPSSPSKGEVHRDISPLELNLEGKNLTDEGLSELAKGLLEALNTGIVHLQILHINQNGLTARSLAELAPCIRAAAEDLEDLDLSGNHITIKTIHDEDRWEYFLESFRYCGAIRRLDLSNNEMGDSRAFEILSRVYLRQFRATKLTWEKEITLGAKSPIFEEGYSLDKQVAALSVRDENIPQGTPSSKSKRDMHDFGARGLPAIPFIGLTNVSMKDGDTLFLSGVFQRHRWMQSKVLMNQWGRAAPGGPAASRIALESNNFQATGNKMLRLAETVPYNPFTLPSSPTTSALVLRRGTVSESPAPPPRRSSGAEVQSRRVSEGASLGPDSRPASRTPSSSQQSPQQDIDSLEKKLQRTIIENSGIHHVALWSAALKLLTYTRPILIKDRSLINFPVLGPEQSGKPRLPSSLEDSPTKGKSSSVMRKSSAPTYASKLQVNRNGAGPVLSVTGESSRPVTPHVADWLRKSSRSQDKTASPARTPGHRSRASAGGSSSQSKDKISPLKGAITMTGERQYDTSGRLPTEACRRIICELADPRRLLSSRQREAVLTYGANRRTLATEAASLGKPDSVQIWRVLEAMGCLFYDEEA